MRIHAYLLAADPCWLEAGVSSYYDLVEKIVVSYDQEHRGFSGHGKMPIEECIKRLKAIDRDSKIIFSPGDYGRPDFESMQNETNQRQHALQEAGEGADWVLQLDNDEVLPNPQALLEVLDYARAMDIPAVEWPMRVLFRTMKDGRFLEVCGRTGGPRFEYPGSICVRPSVTLSHARIVEGDFVRPVVAGDRDSLQILRPAAANEYRIALESAEDAVIHNSWGRPASSIRQKVASWGHNEGLKTWMFYYLRWLPAKYLWRWTRDFHPFARGLWPALKPLHALPSSIPAEFARRTS